MKTGFLETYKKTFVFWKAEEFFVQEGFVLLERSWIPGQLPDSDLFHNFSTFCVRIVPCCNMMIEFCIILFGYG